MFYLFESLLLKTINFKVNATESKSSFKKHQTSNSSSYFNLASGMIVAYLFTKYIFCLLPLSWNWIASCHFLPSICTQLLHSRTQTQRSNNESGTEGGWEMWPAEWISDPPEHGWWYRIRPGSLCDQELKGCLPNFISAEPRRLALQPRGGK